MTSPTMKAEFGEPPYRSPDVYATVLGCLVEIASRRSSPLVVIGP